MQHSPPIEVKVVYTASGRRRRRTVRPSAPVRLKRYAVLGFLNLLVAAALYAATWWWADPELRVRVLMHAPLPGVDIGSLDRPRPVQPRPEDAPWLETVTPPPREEKELKTPANLKIPWAQSESAQAVLFLATFAGWEALSTMAALCVALCGGATIGRWGGFHYRRAGRWLTIAAVLLLISAAAYVWNQYGLRYTPSHFRVAIGLLTLLTLAAGMWIGRGIRGTAFLAGLMVILAAAGTLFGLYIGTQFEAFRSAELPFPLMATLLLAFAVHSLWGWVLLAVAWRMGR